MLRIAAFFLKSLESSWSSSFHLIPYLQFSTRKSSRSFLANSDVIVYAMYREKHDKRCIEYWHICREKTWLLKSLVSLNVILNSRVLWCSFSYLSWLQGRRNCLQPLSNDCQSWCVSKSGSSLSFADVFFILLFVQMWNGTQRKDRTNVSSDVNAVIRIYIKSVVLHRC